MGWAHAVATRKSKRSLPDVPEGPVAVALLTDVAFQPCVGNGRAPDADGSRNWMPVAGRNDPAVARMF